MDIISPLIFLLFLTLANANTDYTADWWTWVMNNNQTNLLLDKTGDDIMKYQPDSDMYFLTGAYGSNQTRNITIPADNNKPILIPVLNGFAGCETCNIFQRVVRMTDLASDINNAVSMEAQLDDKDIANQIQRIKSNVFELTIKEHNPFLYLKDSIGKTIPVIADGYWVVLDPLSPGEHKLMTHGIDKNGYSSEVRYNIKVN